MQEFSISTSKAVLAIAAIATLSACGGHGAYSYLMPKDALIAKLAQGEKSYEYIGGSQRKISAVSRNGNVVNVKLTNADNQGGTVYCKVIVEEIDEEWSRATPDCADKDDAFENTLSEINQMQVDEFVTAVLYDKPIDEAMIAKRTSAVAIGNINEMVAEANEAAQEVSNQSSDWGSDGDSDWGSN